MGKTRRRFSPAEKAKIALGAIKGIHPNHGTNSAVAAAEAGAAATRRRGALLPANLGGEGSSLSLLISFFQNCTEISNERLDPFSWPATCFFH